MSFFDRASTIGYPPPDRDAVRAYGSVPPHSHKWQGIAVERRISNAPSSVIQSCECGEVRRVEIPE